MYLIKKAIVEKVNNLLETYTGINGLKLEAQRSATKFPAIVYQFDSFAEEADNVQNALVTFTFHSSKDINEVEHNKLIQFLKRNLDRKQLTATDPTTQEDVSGRFVFNSTSDVSDRDDAISTSLIFDMRYFISEKCI